MESRARATQVEEETRQSLVRAYKKGHLALGVGAGVSKGSNVPDWAELMYRVAGQLPGVSPQIVEDLYGDGYDSTVIASYLRSAAGSERRFVTAVRDALYRDFGFAEPVSKSNHRRFATFIRNTNSTLHAIGTMCGVRVEGTQDQYRPNRLIRAVMTFNIDALLETYTRARFKARMLRTVERASASASGRLIHSYHVHGFLVHHLPESRRDAPRTMESDDRLILTEQQYFDVFTNGSGFINYTMLFLLREYQFLFVGLSMSDPNLRRALHLSFSERVRELQAEGLSEHDALNHATRHWAVLQHKNEGLDRAAEQLLGDLGVRPLWITLWDELPPLLRDLYETTGHNWDDVA